MVLQFSESERLLTRSSAQIVTKLSGTNSLVYEIFHKTNLYDLCLETLLTSQLEQWKWLVDTLYY